MRKLILLFTSCLYYSFISAAPQKSGPKVRAFPLPLPDLPPYELVTPAFVFDGIDYNELPEKFREPYNDCYGHWLKCIQNRTSFHPACAYKPYYSFWGGFWGYYYSQCEIDLQNCQNRVYYGHGVYGQHYKHDTIIFSGESYYCEKTVLKEDPNVKFD